MKSIVYILIAVFVGGILVSAFPKSDNKEKQTITIQCVDADYTQDMLMESAAIINSRLNDYGIQNAAIMIDSKSSCINVSINSQVELADVSSLLTSKGSVAFYETYDRLDLIKKQGVDQGLAAILTIPTAAEKIDGSSAIYGYCNVDKKSEVVHYLENNNASEAFSGINLFWSEHPNDNGDFNLFLLHEVASMNNTNLAESVVKTNASDNRPELKITFNKSSVSTWKDITERNVNKSIAIVLDEQVLQAPTVKSEITEGKCIVRGDFSEQEINRLSSLINNGELPLKFKLKK